MSGAPRVLLASCSRLPTGDGDDDALVGALAEVGVTAEWAAWNAPGTDFAAAELVVLRATWDYPDHHDDFLAWCGRLPSLVNPLDVVRWNTDKSYLTDLAKDGLPVVPTQLVEPGASADWPEGEAVVKPAVGAGSRGAARFAADRREDAAAHLSALHAAGRTAVVQPYQSAVEQEGETALVFLSGAYSHAFVKGPMLSGSAVGAGSSSAGGRNVAVDTSAVFHAERLRPVAALAAPWRELAEDAMDTAVALLGRRRTDLLYARVDLLPGRDGEPLLLEFEVVEPGLGFRLADAAAPLRFASAVRAALSVRL